MHLLAQCGVHLEVWAGEWRCKHAEFVYARRVDMTSLLSNVFKCFVQVLEEFTQTFDFEGLSFDAGLRIFLESFKLPGEAQKIDRIINCESALAHHSSLCYSSGALARCTLRA